MQRRTTRPPKVALIGSGGMLARAVAKALPDGWRLFGFDLPEFNLVDQKNVVQVCSELRPDLIINCAAFTQVDRCETEEVLCTRVNGDGPGYLAMAAKALGATLVHISTDYVFSGDAGRPYRETDATAPLSAYGRSKLKGEAAILASGLERYFIVRTSWLYGPGGANFVETILRLAAERDELRIVADQVGSPTLTGDLANALLNLVGPRPAAGAAADYGIYHFSNAGQCSWYEFACEIVRLAREAGLPVKAGRIVPITTNDYPLPAQRPKWSVFDKAKYRQATGTSEPDWVDSLRTYFALRQPGSKEQQ